MTDSADLFHPTPEDAARPISRQVVDGVLMLTVREAAFGGSTANALFSSVASWGTGLPEGEGLAVVVDLSGTRFDPSGQELRAGASRVRALGLRGHVALCVGSDFQYGLARMLGILCEGSGVHVRPFRSPTEARSWVLEGPSDDE